MADGERLCEVCGTTTCGGQWVYDGPLPRCLGGDGIDAEPAPTYRGRGRRRRQQHDEEGVEV